VSFAPNDIRWQQRFANFRKALARLAEAIALRQQRGLTELERQGLIQAFEFTHELAWNTLKDIAEFQGATGLLGSRDATRYAFKFGLIEDGENWMNMIESRNLSTHTYNESVAQEVENRIANSYFELFRRLATRLQERIDAN
jgi:nucleotidyltransferase substrate binding protein (TIGR01987 family)